MSMQSKEEFFNMMHEKSEKHKNEMIRLHHKRFAELMYEIRIEGQKKDCDIKLIIEMSNELSDHYFAITNPSMFGPGSALEI